MLQVIKEAIEYISTNHWQTLVLENVAKKLLKTTEMNISYTYFIRFLNLTRVFRDIKRKIVLR